MPAAMTAATASPALRMSSKLAMMQRASCGLGTSLTVTSVITASMPSLPTTSGSRSSPGASSASLPKLDRLALDREAAHAQHVVQRQAVLQAVHAAGVLGHVAADRAGDLAATGRARSTGRSGAAASLMARLRTPHCTVAVRASAVDLHDLVELGQRQRHAQRVRHRAAATGPCRRRAPPPARCSAWQACSTAATWASVSGSATTSGSCAVGGEAVAFVGHGVLALPQQGVRRQQRATARPPPAAWRAARSARAAASAGRQGGVHRQAPEGVDGFRRYGNCSRAAGSKPL